MASGPNFPAVSIAGGGAQLIAEVIDGAFVIHHWGSEIEFDSKRDRNSLASVRTRTRGHSEFDQQPWPGIFHEHSRGFLGSPMLEGHRDGRDWSSRFEVTELKCESGSITFAAEDQSLALRLEGVFTLDQFAILRVTYSLTNLGKTYTLNSLRYWLPLPDKAEEKLDFFGRWSNERQPQRSLIDVGLFSRESREGRSGHSFTIGQLAMARHTNFATGDVWSVALAHSGNSLHQVEKSYEGEQWLGAGEILFPGEVILESGESYHAPTLVASYSSKGLDGIAANHHSSLRARGSHPKRERPLTLNMWEAIYFDHSEERVRRIVDVAAAAGVERVVLDDGWFGSRRNDRSGLGDWIVSKDVWPDGLLPIAEYIRSKGMEFGLWFEGEMVNPDSDLYRNHPDWVLRSLQRTAPLWRHELVLDLAKEEVFDFLFEKVSKVIGEVGVSYIKWDHNRVLVDADGDGRARYRLQVAAIYRFFDALKAAHPGLEIESCASGGARIDLGIIDHVDRFWTSDNNDARARQSIQRWSAQFVPPELLGTHIGSYPSHQSGKSTPLAMRAATALFGHAGIEWDITSTDDSERKLLRNWGTYYKKNRKWMHQGMMIRVDHPDAAAYLYGVVSSDQSRALYTYAQLEPSANSHPVNLRFRGLDAKRRYRLAAIFPAGIPRLMAHTAPPWYEGVELSGSALSEIGITAPILEPENALLIEIIAL